MAITSNCLFGYPFYSDPSATYTPTIAGGSWVGTLPLSNLQNRYLTKIARSSSSALKDTRFHWDLGRVCRIGLVGMPKHTLSALGKVRVLGRDASLGFNYESGYDISTMGGTFARADASTCATYRDQDGTLRVVAANVLRDSHFINGIRHTLVELGKANLAIQSGNLANAAYSDVGTPTTTAAYALAPDGTLTATRVQDQSAGSVDGRRQTFVVANDNTQYCCSWFVKKAAALGTGYPVFNARLTGGTGVDDYLVLNPVDGTFFVNGGTGGVESWNTDYWRVWITVQNNTTGNTSLLATAFPAYSSAPGAVTIDITKLGEIVVWGLQVEIGAVPSSYIPTLAAAVTRAFDVLYFTLPAALTPQLTTYYAKWTERGSIGIANARVFQLTDAAGATPRYLMYAPSVAGYASYMENAAAAISTSQSGSVPAIGAVVEGRGVVRTSGVTQMYTSTNGAAEVVGPVGATIAMPATWGAGGAMLLIVGGGTTAGANGHLALQSIRIQAASELTMAQMRSSVYDSGWLDAWPTVFPPGVLPTDDPRYATGKYDADDQSETNIGFIHIPPSSQLWRYVCCQIGDASNAAGYVDLGRFVIAGSYQPTLNMIQGAALDLTTSSTMTETDGGADIPFDQPRRRGQMFSFDDVGEDEGLVMMFDMVRRLGITRQLYFVHDATDTYHMHRRAYLSTLRELKGLSYPYGRAVGSVFSVKEVIG